MMNLKLNYEIFLENGVYVILENDIEVERGKYNKKIPLVEVLKMYILGR